MYTTMVALPTRERTLPTVSHRIDSPHPLQTPIQTRGNKNNRKHPTTAAATGQTKIHRGRHRPRLFFSFTTTGGKFHPRRNSTPKCFLPTTNLLRQPTMMISPSESMPKQAHQRPTTPHQHETTPSKLVHNRLQTTPQQSTYQLFHRNEQVIMQTTPPPSPRQPTNTERRIQQHAILEPFPTTTHASKNTQQPPKHTITQPSN